jgi:histidinol-phosphate aminotransferase
MSYFRENIDKLAGYTPGFQPDSADVIKLNTNENPYPPSPKVTKAIAGVSAESLRKYPCPFLGDTFRDAAAEVLSVDADYIICTNGGDDLLTIAIRSFCDHNRPIAYPGPTYSLYPVLSDIQNCPPDIEIPFGKDGSLPDELASTGAALTIVCNPNAPTGSFISPEEIKKLADKLKGKSILLVDEAYADYAQDNCLKLIDECENVIILRSMSKGYSLCGLRFGFGIAPKPIIEGLRKVKDSYNVDTISIAAATAAMKDQEYFKANIEKVISERTRLTESLRQLSMEVPDSQSNFVLAKCTNCDAAGIYEQLAEKNIYVRYFKLAGLTDKLRITVGTKEQNDKLIAALKSILS